MYSNVLFNKKLFFEVTRTINRENRKDNNYAFLVKGVQELA